MRYFGKSLQDETLNRGADILKGPHGIAMARDVRWEWGEVQQPRRRRCQAPGLVVPEPTFPLPAPLSLQARRVEGQKVDMGDVYQRLAAWENSENAAAAAGSSA